jgi:TPP-dependent pyruvate/acetoin dehydrogenase alpha subunit
VTRAGQRLLDRGIATQVQLDGWRAEVKAEMACVVAEAKASPWPDASTLFENVY